MSCEVTAFRFLEVIPGNTMPVAELSFEDTLARWLKGVSHFENSVLGNAQLTCPDFPI